MLGFISDLLFPKRCVGCRRIGSYLCDNCLSHIEIYQDYVCPMCMRRSITGETHPSCITSFGMSGLTCGVVYKGVVKKLLFRFKFNPYMKDLASTARALFIDSLSQQELFMRLLYSQPIVVEVPLSSEKMRKRGYNQAEILAHQLAQEFQLEFKPQILIRTKKTNPQFRLNKRQREQNILGAFEINQKRKKQIQGETVLLVDDLATSGATLRECTKVLRRNGAKKVYGVTFAREL